MSFSDWPFVSLLSPNDKVFLRQSSMAAISKIFSCADPGCHAWQISRPAAILSA